MIGNVVLPVFFLYFVLVSGYCSTLLNCGLQRFMRDSVYFKHFLIFLSIYIFTFILNWYTFDSMAISQEKFQNEKFQNENIINSQFSSLKQLGLWFVYSIFIYLVFLLTTKSEVTFILLFIAFTIISLVIQILIKSLSSKSYSNSKNKLLITSEDYNDINKKFVIYAHNTVSIGFVITMGLVIYGFYKYFKRQWKDHSHHWKWEKFIFGTSKCSDD